MPYDYDDVYHSSWLACDRRNEEIAEGRNRERRARELSEDLQFEKEQEEERWYYKQLQEAQMKKAYEEDMKELYEKESKEYSDYIERQYLDYLFETGIPNDVY